MLYFEPRLSSSHLISCNTCHNVGLAGADLQETSVGHTWQKGARNAPTIFNAIFNIAQFWDGRADTLAEQAKGSVRNLALTSLCFHSEKIWSLDDAVAIMGTAQLGETLPPDEVGLIESFLQTFFSRIYFMAIARLV